MWHERTIFLVSETILLTVTDNFFDILQKALGHKSIEVTARHYVLDELEIGLTDNLY